MILSLARARLSFTFPLPPLLSLSSSKGREKKAAFSSRRAFLLDISLSLPLIFVKNVARGKKEKKRKMLPNFVNSFEPFLAQFDDSRNFGGKLSSRGNRSDRNQVGEILFFLS